jgi:hypothetical protein
MTFNNDLLGRTIIPLVVDKDTCPDRDNIIIRGQCAGCKHYKGFKVDEFGQQCIVCSYMLDIHTD